MAVSTRRPLKPAYLVHAFGAGVRLDTKPEHRQYHAADNAKIAEPEPKRRAVQDRERDVQSCTDGAVQDHNDGYDYMPDCYRGQSLSPNIDL